MWPAAGWRAMWSCTPAVGLRRRNAHRGGGRGTGYRSGRRPPLSGGGRASAGLQWAAPRRAANNFERMRVSSWTCAFRRRWGADPGGAEDPGLYQHQHRYLPVFVHWAAGGAAGALRRHGLPLRPPCGLPGLQGAEISGAGAVSGPGGKAGGHTQSGSAFFPTGLAGAAAGVSGDDHTAALHRGV